MVNVKFIEALLDYFNTNTTKRFFSRKENGYTGLLQVQFGE